MQGTNNKTLGGLPIQHVVREYLKQRYSQPPVLSPQSIVTATLLHGRK